MGKVKQIKIKSCTYYFDSDIINLKNFESDLLQIGKNHYKGADIYYVGYITKKIVIGKIFTVQILGICLLIMQVDILKKKMEINT